jgi:hypothetical protein
MEFKLHASNRPSVFIPYKTHKNNYHLLFTKEVPKGTVISVNDSEITLDTFFRIGQMTLNGYAGERCGFVFHTPFSVSCHGTCIIAYSKNWANSVNSGRYPIRPFGMALLLRAKYFYIYHKKNQSTLIVNPDIAKHIKENLEI